jgi:hypothetical protein
MELPDPAAQRIGALVVGVEEYAPPLKRLPGATKSARDIVNWLTQSCGTPAGNIYLHLSGAQKEHGANQALLGELVKSKEKLKTINADTLVFYWAGHGDIEHKDRRIYTADSGEIQHAIDLDSLLDSLASVAMPFKHVIAFVDACATRSDLGYAAGRPPEAKSKKRATQYAYFATALGEEANYQNGGLFTARLLVSLQDRALPLVPERLDEILAPAFRDLRLQRPCRTFVRRGDDDTLTLEPDEALREIMASAGAAALGRRMGTSNPIIAFFQRLFSRFKSRYLRHVIERHSRDPRTLSITRPFTLEIGESYVELMMAPKPTHQAVPNPLGAKRHSANAHDIWWYLTAPEHSRSHFAILGAAGTGKTTLIRHLAITLAARRRPGPTIPIVLSLRNDVRPNLKLSLAEIVRRSLADYQLFPPPDWFDIQLQRRRCIVLLDGLDEISDPTGRADVAAWVDIQTLSYSSNRFIVTSRPFGYRENPLQNVVILQVEPLSLPQARTFIRNWFLAVEARTQRHSQSELENAARVSAAPLLARLDKSDSIAEFAANPLLLKIACTVTRDGRTLSGRRIDLYGEIFPVFLKRLKDPKRSSGPIDIKDSQRALECLAWVMMRRSVRQLKVRDAVRILRTRAVNLPATLTPTLLLEALHEESGLFLDEEGRHAFSHLSFQEYLAAVHARNNGRGQHLLDNIGKTWWRQTLVFFAALGAADEVIAACLADEEPSVAKLSLALECAEESENVSEALRRKLDVVRGSWINDQDPERRRLAAEVELALRLRRMVRQREDLYLTPSLLTNAEYQLFLDERAPVGQFRYPDHWTTRASSVQQGRDPVYGVRSSDAEEFCNWLTEREQGTWKYIIPPAEEDADVSHWTMVGTEPSCKPPPNIPPLISRTHLTKRVFEDFCRAFQRWHSEADATVRAREQAVETKLQKQSLDTSIAHFAILVGNEYADPFPASALASAIKLALEHARTMENAWDPDLADILTPKDPDWFISQPVVDLAPDLELMEAVPHFLDVGRIVSSVVELIGDKPVNGQLDSEIGPDLSRVRKSIDRALVRDCKFMLDREQWLDPTITDVAEMVRWQARLRAAIAAGMHRLHPGVSVDRPRFEGYRRLYLALATLELRIGNPALAFEGIRVAKERERVQ